MQNITEMNPQNKRNLIISGAVILLVLIALFVAPAVKNKAVNDKKSDEESSLPDCRPGDKFSGQTGKPCPAEAGVQGASTKKATDPYKGTGYAAALASYTGKSVLFKADCSATPAELSQSVGSRVMIANDSAATLTLSFKGRSERLAPYHYFLAPLTAAGDFSVQCNGNNAATVRVQ